MAIEVLKNPGIGSGNAQRVLAAGLSALRNWRLVPFIVGAVLVVAALGKTHQLWTEGMPEPTLDSWGLVALIELELALSAGLIANILPSILRAAALILTASFLGVALSKVADGAPSCGCAGDLVKLSPLAAAIGDAFILFALWRWRPEPERRLSWLKGASALGLLLLAPLAPLAAFQSAPYPRLIVAPLIDLGRLVPAERKTFAFSVRNPHDQPVELVRVDSSCPCLESDAVPIGLLPGQERMLQMTLDLSREPAFSGPLLIEIEGIAAAEGVAFVVRVAIEIQALAVTKVNKGS